MGNNHKARTVFALMIVTISPVVVVSSGGRADYVGDISASVSARAHFIAVPSDLKPRKVSRKDAPKDNPSDEAHYTGDGGIYIPSGAMVTFQNSGKCMDPYLPAPVRGEPMQFVNSDRMIPRPLRQTYDTLLERNARGDPIVAANNLQHLIWAICTAGTEDPLANNLSDSQLEFLNQCSGRRNGFIRYHEREKKRNEKIRYCVHIQSK